MAALACGSAAADTDYRCLKACIDSSSTSQQCMLKCRYDTKTLPEASYPRTDSKCLKQCMNPDAAVGGSGNASSGDTALSCMPQCTSAPQESTPKAVPAGQQPSMTHNVFTPLKPYDGTLLGKKPSDGGSPRKDFECMSVCQQAGLQYQLCDQHCSQ